MCADFQFFEAFGFFLLVCRAMWLFLQQMGRLK
jgi:hypothetical protein